MNTTKKTHIITTRKVKNKIKEQKQYGTSRRGSGIIPY